MSASANSQRTRRVVYDGLNLALGEGTGIATYTRVLAHIARSLGYEIGVVYGVPLPSTEDPLLQEVLFFDQMRASNRGATVSPLRAFSNYLSYFSVIHPSPLRLGNVVITEEFKDRLPELDRAYFVPNLFDNASWFLSTSRRIPRRASA